MLSSFRKKMTGGSTLECGDESVVNTNNPKAIKESIPDPALNSSMLQPHPAASDLDNNTVTDGRTVDGTVASTYVMSRYHDEPEVDYDKDGATDLYRHIENKDWDGAIARAEDAPFEAKTWVSRRELHDPEKIRWRLLPLHATCVFRSPLSLIEALISAYPDGPQMKDDQGMLPVHLACRNGASKGVVVTLLNAFPESIGVKDRKGRVPLNLVEASQSQNREAVIIAMKKFKAEIDNKTLPKPATRSSSNLSSTGKAENEVDYEHRTILFRLVLKKDWNGTVQRSNSFPDEAGTWIVTKGFNGNLRFLPIHKACVLQPPETVIESLIGSFPEGAKSRDQDGWLPLHCATFYGAEEAVINTLLVANPKGAQCKDDEGRLPLHYACLKGGADGVVSSLLGSFPKGAMSKDDEGRLPIHYACSKGATPEVIEALLKTSPKGAQSKDDQGRLPLHHACRKGATERVIRTLLKVYPRGCQVKDDQDKLPVHYACQNGADATVIEVLLVAFPESINVKNGFGYTPLAEARAMDTPKMEGVIQVLEKFKKEQDELKAQLNGNPDGAGGSGGGVAGSGGGSDHANSLALEAKVSMLSQRVVQLEMILREVGQMGRDLKANMSKGRDMDSAVRKFADKLSTIDSQLGGEADVVRGVQTRENNQKAANV